MPVRRLPETTVNRIAAGEVIERPASVVKELTENALDAGATRIEIVTDGGGRRLIRVTDDGGGMSRGDLELAIERHATSKLDGDDLMQIDTLGFRGEALPSIGSVGKLSIATRHAGEPHAWSIEVQGGQKSGLKPAALSEGTRVEVKDLFYATPARLKFLKQDRTEAEAVRDVVRRLAMSRPDVAFTLAGEERAPLTWPAALPGAPGRLARLADILGPEFRANAVEVKEEREDVTVEGVIALPTLSRANSLGQYLFVNGRPVRDKLLLGVVRGAYADYLPRDRHPIVALFITLPPREVDVNVHPAKTEVRFRNAALVRSLLMHALKEGAGPRGRPRRIDRRQRHHRGVPPRRIAQRGNFDWRRSFARPGTPARTAVAAWASTDPAGFAEAAQAGFRRRRRGRDGARRSRRAGGRCARPAARRRARAGARHLHRGADPRRPGDRRSARRARAAGLRAHEERARPVRRGAADPADPGDRRAR